MATLHILASLALRTPSPASGTGAVTPATAAVTSWLAESPSVMLPRKALSPNIRFASDVCSFSGATEYCKVATRWHAESASTLSQYETSVLRIAAVGDDEVSVRWRTTWASDSSLWLCRLSQLLRWRVVRVAVDPKVVSTFSWAAVGKLLVSAVSTGKLHLPASAIEGTTRLTIEPQPDGSRESNDAAHHEALMRVTVQRESVDLVALADANGLQNRRAAQDVATWLDFRRPSTVEPEEWAAIVRARVLSRVPGAGTLDIEPMSNETEGPLALSLFALVMAAALGASLYIGLGGDHGATGAAGEWGASICDEVGAAGDWGYNQCVSDLYT